MPRQEIVLINMPFGDVSVPSLALTQLKYVVETDCQDVAVRVLYLNHEFARFLGLEIYQAIAREVWHHNTGFGDWFFRQAAFPELPDNSSDYLTRYYPQRHPNNRAFTAQALRKRSQLRPWLLEAIARHDLGRAALVGMTTMFMQSAACLAMARALKSGGTGPLVAMGGANCEHPMGAELVKNVPELDFVFSGPALVSFPTVVRRVLADPHDPCDDIAGVVTMRRRSGGLSLSRGVSLDGAARPAVLGEERPIDDVIPLDYHSFLDSFESKVPDCETRPSLTFETSRGCWWGEKAHCTFCGLNGSTMAYRAMAPAKAIAMFESLFAYAPRVGHIQCVDNILPRHYVDEVLAKLRPPPHFYIFYEIKADVSEREVQTLAASGVRRIQPGIEALATSTLKLMKKGTNAFQNVALLKHCARYGIGPAWNLLIGFPGETAEVYEKYVRDLPLLTHLPPPNGMFPVRFDRYSPYYMRAREYGLDLKPYDYYGLTYPFSDDSLMRWAYFFADQNFEAPYFVAAMEWIDRIRAAVKRWNALWEHGQRPRLEMRRHGDAWRVEDSRSGSPAVYPLSATAAALLERMAVQPLAADRLHESGHADKASVERDLVELRARGLLFEEGDRMMSLVLKADAATPPLANRELVEHASSR